MENKVKKNDDNRTRGDIVQNSPVQSSGGQKTMPPGRTPMPIELRAKQFMPFAAVTGLEAALREKERAREEQ